MDIVYKSDNEPASTMTLETLIANFKESGGFVCGHNETDMREELASRGWYEGLHENGKYIVLNVNSMKVVPHPDCPVKRPTFWQWFGGVEKDALASPAGVFMKGHGYGIAHTGGGCLAWEKRGTDWQVWVTDGDAGLGVEEHGAAFQTARDFGCMLTNEDGDFVNGPQGSTIEECIEWGQTALADPAAAQKAVQDECRHRDSGRGECVHCGKAL